MIVPRAEWRVLIADDEPLARRGVRQLLAAFPDFEVVGECRNGMEVLACLDVLRPHVVFLDVQMPGATGFDVIRRRTPERMPVVIFLTAWDEFALKAFDAQALDYLVKPVSASRFGTTMKRLTRLLRAGAPAVPAPEPVLAAATAQGTTLIALRDIEWIEAADNYVRVFAGGRTHLVREAMNAIEKRLKERGFVRAHRGALIQVTAIRSASHARDGRTELILESGARVPVSRRRRSRVNAILRARAMSA